MTLLGSVFARPRLRRWIVAVVVLSAAALLWIGYRAVREWQHAAALVAALLAMQREAATIAEETR